ncbi:hypothetical protein [Streptomyces sp. NPDC086766]|uniref:hypothetical protein n=1 Tax=Streptomyces sp. NPDC086766 TaxID=3365754 RepID=UPI0037F18E7E
MKSTTRGTLAAVITGVAAAVGAAATPAAAANTVPVAVPLTGAEQALGTELPEVGGEIPLPAASTPETPRFVTGRLMPERTVPQVPVNGGLPGLGARAPLAHVLGHGFDHVGVAAPAVPLRTLAPGLSMDAPLTAPNPAGSQLPELKQPEIGILAPVLRTDPAAALTAGPGR